MHIIPAIDLKDGQCVRLKQGLMEESTVFSSNPSSMASQWMQEGAQRLHLVDLNGAFEGKPVNEAAILEITQNHPDLPIQIGGGIRNMDTVKAYIDAGVDWVIIGTQAVRDPDFVAAACNAYPGKIIVSLDAKKGMVAIDGWAKVTELKAAILAQQFENMGVSSIVYTDIDRDGMMQGVNIPETVQMAQSSSIPIIASGGITNISDVKALAEVADQGIIGAITGRALYEGTLDLATAQAYCQAS